MACHSTSFLKGFLKTHTIVDCAQITCGGSEKHEIELLLKLEGFEKSKS